jgi:sugar O-acyltransferase (sialic acid O-acetyltransferase NeuD family)
MTVQGWSADVGIWFIGAGSHASVLREAADALGLRVAGYIVQKGAQSADKRQDIVCEPDFIRHRNKLSVSLVNAVGSVDIPSQRMAVYQRFRHSGYKFHPIIHPSAIVSASAQVHPDIQIMAGAIVQANALFGANVLINTRAVIEHDCVIGAHVHVASGAIIAGGVAVGDMSMIGAGAVVRQQIKIGTGALVAAGSVVVADVPDGSSVAGVPARPIVRRHL